VTPRYKHLPTQCYHVKVGSSASKGVCINRRESPNSGSVGAPPPCGRGVADPLEIRSSPISTSAKFGRSRSNGTIVIKEIGLKF